LRFKSLLFDGGQMAGVPELPFGYRIPAKVGETTEAACRLNTIFLQLFALENKMLFGFVCMAKSPPGHYLAFGTLLWLSFFKVNIPIGLSKLFWLAAALSYGGQGDNTILTAQKFRIPGTVHDERG